MPTHTTTTAQFFRGFTCFLCVLCLEIEDYRVNNAPLQFVEAGGNQTQCAYVQVVSDNIFELTEFFRLLLISDDPGVVVITPYANIRIKDSADPEI